MIDYPTFSKLYDTAAESSDETTFILKTGWHSWMNSFKSAAVDFLKETYRLAHGGMSAIVDSFPMLKNCAEEFQIPYKTVQKWATGGAAPADYLIKMMAYTIAIKATIKEKNKMEIREKIIEAIIEATERALNGNIGNYYSAYITREGEIYYSEEVSINSIPEAVYNGKDRTICQAQAVELWDSDEDRYDTYVSYMDDEQKIQLAAYVDSEKEKYEPESRIGIEYIETTFPQIAEEADRILINDILNDLRYCLENGTSEYEETIAEIVEWVDDND